MSKPIQATLAEFNERAKGYFPAHLGIVATNVGDRTIDMELPVRPELLAPNGYLHAGSIVTLADTAAGFGCLANLPEGGESFTTIELKSNFLGTARDGKLACQARLVHAGRTTQVWDATVTHAETGRAVALFRCTQMILYPKSK